MGSGESDARGCPTCGEEIGHILFKAGEYTYQPCGCPVSEIDDEK